MKAQTVVVTFITLLVIATVVFVVDAAISEFANNFANTLTK